MLIELLAKLNGGSGISRAAGCLPFSVKALRPRANLDCESDVNGKTAIYATIPGRGAKCSPEYAYRLPRCVSEMSYYSAERLLFKHIHV